MKRAKQLTVYGSVQGVGFRYYTLQCARTHGVYGWVKNTASGTVEIHCEGDDYCLRNFVRAVKKGSAFSTVSTVDEKDVGCEFHVDFEIRY